jgi:hypothetical protein
MQTETIRLGLYFTLSSHVKTFSKTLFQHTLLHKTSLLMEQIFLSKRHHYLHLNPSINVTLGDNLSIYNSSALHRDSVHGAISFAIISN